ncbi:MAG: UDP-N-acetylglucosamine 1-carboxyvinyltransferase [Clostridia bacterium]|nr:UDP-N-acetylglucosamine 1-carboxyvinyltransferase [Clostridia bacterium]
MEQLVINGGHSLYGEIAIGGMKNSALPVIFATLLIKDECVIYNVPLVSDIINSIEILKQMGAKAELTENHTLIINTRDVQDEIKGYELISKMRASSYLMGTMLSRAKKAYLPMPGGCNFGARPIEQHLKGFSMLGANCSCENGFISINASKLLKSTKITLDKISVGATINIVLASVFVEGVTVIENVAIEPHVDDLICFLNTAGAKILRVGRKIYCEGVKKLHSVRYRIFPDMIEALTYMTFVGACSGDINLTGVNYEHIKYVCDIFRKMGFEIDAYYDEARVKAGKNLVGASIETAPYPLFPTDLHPQFSSLLCFTKDGGEIKESIFPTRFAYAYELEKMGAKIKREDNVVKINPSNLSPASLDATDLRAGAALVCASLGTNGTSRINNVNYIVRGYENLVGKVSSLGGKIKLLKGE